MRFDFNAFMHFILFITQAHMLE